MNYKAWPLKALDALGDVASDPHPAVSLAPIYSSIKDIIIAPPSCCSQDPSSPSLSPSLENSPAMKDLGLDIPFFISVPDCQLPQEIVSVSAMAMKSSGGFVSTSGRPNIEWGQGMCSRSFLPWKPARDGPPFSVLRRSMGIEIITRQWPNENRMTPLSHLGMIDPANLAKHVEMLKEGSDHSIPVIIRSDGLHLKEDIEAAIIAEADAIHFIDTGDQLPGSGIWNPPTLHHLARAKRVMEDLAPEGPRPAIMVSGDFRSSIDITIALAMGADLIGLGVAPWIVAGGSLDSDDIDSPIIFQEGIELEPISTSLTNYLKTLEAELTYILSLLGKMEVDELERNDLRVISYDKAATTGIKISGYDREMAMWFH